MVRGGAWLVLGSLAVVTLAAWLLVPLLLAQEEPLPRHTIRSVLWHHGGLNPEESPWH